MYLPRLIVCIMFWDMKGFADALRWAWMVSSLVRHVGAFWNVIFPFNCPKCLNFLNLELSSTGWVASGRQCVLTAEVFINQDETVGFLSRTCSLINVTFLPKISSFLSAYWSQIFSFSFFSWVRENEIQIRFVYQYSVHLEASICKLTTYFRTIQTRRRLVSMTVLRG